MNIADRALDWGMDHLASWIVLGLIAVAVVMVGVLVWSLTFGNGPSGVFVHFGNRGCYVVNTTYNPALKLTQTHSAYLSEPVCAAIVEAKEQ